MIAIRFIFRILRFRGRSRNLTKLQYAVFANKLSEIHKQIENGADIDATTSFGETALHIACRYSDEEVIETILNYRPCLNLTENVLNMTPLIILAAFQRHKLSIFRKMLDMGANPNLSRSNGDTALHILAKAEYLHKREAIRQAQVLLEYKANVNAKNAYNNTPLHTAIEKGFHEIIPILLKNGASIKIRNCLGYNPLKYAFKRKKKFQRPLDEIVKYIIIKASNEEENNDDLLEELYKFKCLKLFKEKCDEEFVELKRSITDETYVSYYDLLRLPINTVAKYMRNEDILRLVITIDQDKYLFGHVLYRIARDASKRNRALEIASQFIRQYFPVILPDLCIDQILKYLTDKDIMMLNNVTSVRNLYQYETYSNAYNIFISSIH